MRIELMIAGVGLAASAAMAQDYYNQGAFQAAAAANLCTQLFVEDFQESGTGYGGVGMPDFLTNAPHAFPYTNGILHPLTLQSNLDQANTGNGANLNPRNSPAALAAWEGGIGFPATNAVTANYFVDGLDTIVNIPNACAVGFNPMCYSGGDQIQIQIFDTGNVLLGTFFSNGDQNEQDFFGYVSAVPIGRVNIYGLGNNSEGADNFEVWVPIPAPGAAALLGLGGLIAGRRRRA
jgi:hypothetical protein